MSHLLAAARSWVDRIHVNASWAGVREGRSVWVKRRRFGAGLTMRLANGFFRLAQNPVEAIARTAEWGAWEMDCFRRLHGPEYSAGLDRNGTAWIQLLPGESLSLHLHAGTLTPEMLAAAARELRRVHALDCPHYGGGWSHGDPHTGNFLYDAAADRARLIDFEVRHLSALSTGERHVDDLLVVLQDVCGRCRAADWLPLAHAFIAAYARPEIAIRLPEKLRVPRGFPRLWWAVRTTWLPQEELAGRLAALRHGLSDVVSI